MKITTFNINMSPASRRSKRSEMLAMARCGVGAEELEHSRDPREECEPDLTRNHPPDDPDNTHSRYIEAAVNGVLIACVYLPNGNPQPGPKFDYELAWFETASTTCGYGST